MILFYVISFAIFLSFHQYVTKNMKTKMKNRPADIPVNFLSFKNAMKTINNHKEYQPPIEKPHHMEFSMV